MTVTCPNCKTIYNLPGEKAKPTAKLRCTVCKQIFAMPADAAPEPPHPAHPAAQDAPQEPLSISLKSVGPVAKAAAKAPKKSRWPLVLLLVALLAGGGYALTQFEATAPYLAPVLEPLKKLLGAGSASEGQGGQDEKARLAALNALVGQIQVQGLRQFSVVNEKIGKIAVMEGKVVNKFDDPRELIRVEASLYDEQGNLLTSKSQYAGSTVSLFQLQVLSEEELEQALNNRLDILTNNTNVPPGGAVPFMIIFYSTPSNASDFKVTVIDAQKPAPAQ